MSNRAWSLDEEKELLEKYIAEDIKDVNILSEYFGKGYRSVISKLVQLKVYVKPEEELPEKSKTVKVMLRDLEIMLDFKIEGTNLNKKNNLINLVAAVTKLYEAK